MLGIKILWICSNIAASSDMAAVTIFKDELFNYALQSLCDGELEDVCIMKEAVYLIVNTFYILPTPFKLELIKANIVEIEDPTKSLISALVEALSFGINTDVTISSLQ